LPIVSFRDLGDRMGEANALTDLGSALYFLDDYADAMRCGVRRRRWVSTATSENS
jgi:hypothetical protein